MLNNCTLMGRLTRDPELRRTGNGIAVASFTIAVDRDVASKENGEKKTDFFDCVAWRGTGEFISKYFRKGSMIVISARAEQRQWTDKEGNKRNSIEFNVDNAYFGEGKKDGGNNAGNNASGYGYAAPTAPAAGYSAPVAAPAPVNNQQGAAAPQYGGTPQGYAAPSYGYQPVAPATDFAMLEDSDAQLPF